jgi:hypothetical protein
MANYNIEELLEDYDTKMIVNSIFSVGLENNARVFDYPDYKTIHFGETQRGAIDDGTINYKYNNLGYRCDTFLQKTDGVRVLFSGCSETAGIGNNIDDMWTTKVYKHLEKNSAVDGYFNLGLSGSGYTRIINNVFNHMKIYGSADYVFILFPNIARWTEWIDDSTGYRNIGLNEWHGLEKNKDDTDIKTQRNNLINFITMIKLFEAFCKLNNTKLYWSTWDKNDEHNYKLLSKKEIFKNFISLEISNIEELLLNESNSKKDKTYFFTRDHHLGVGWQDCFADSFIDRLTRGDNANI